jgi:hypothetical protein
MPTEILLAVLAFGTIGAVLALAWRSNVATEERRRTASRKSTLAADTPNRAPGGVRPPDT